MGTGLIWLRTGITGRLSRSCHWAGQMKNIWNKVINSLCTAGSSDLLASPVRWATPLPPCFPHNIRIHQSLHFYQSLKLEYLSTYAALSFSSNRAIQFLFHVSVPDGSWSHVTLKLYFSKGHPESLQSARTLVVQTILYSVLFFVWHGKLNLLLSRPMLCVNSVSVPYNMTPMQL